MQLIFYAENTLREPIHRILADFPAAPQLEVFECRIVYERNNIAVGVRLPLLFAGQAPKLHTLRLQGIVAWERGSFQGLRRLSITGLPGTASQTMSLRGLLEVLSHSPALHHLHLSHLDPWVHHDGRASPASDLCGPEDVIFLKCLRVMSITHCHMAQLATLFTHISLPANLFLSLTEILPPQFQQFMNIYYIFLANPTYFPNLNDLHFMRIQHSRSVSTAGPSGTLRLSVQKSAWNHSLPGVYDIGRLLYARNLQELWVEWNDGQSATHTRVDWLSLLSSVPSLRILCLRHRRDTDAMLAALAPDPEGHSHVVCEHLHTLLLENVQHPYDALLHCAQLRFACGHPLRHVCIAQKNRSEDEEKIRGVMNAMEVYVETVFCGDADLPDPCLRYLELEHRRKGGRERNRVELVSFRSGRN